MKPDHERRNVSEVLLDVIARSCSEERTVYAYEYDEKTERRTSALQRTRARGPRR